MKLQKDYNKKIEEENRMIFKIGQTNEDGEGINEADALQQMCIAYEKLTRSLNDIVLKHYPEIEDNVTADEAVLLIEKLLD
jgi:hypothetical protein